MPYTCTIVNTLILACTSFIEHSAIFYITSSHLQHKYIHYESSQMYFNLSAVGVVYILYVCAMHAGRLTCREQMGDSMHKCHHFYNLARSDIFQVRLSVKLQTKVHTCVSYETKYVCMYVCRH